MGTVSTAASFVQAMCAPEDEDKQIQWEPDRARWEPIDRTLTPNAAQMSRKFAAILLVLTCFDSFVVCKPCYFVYVCTLCLARQRREYYFTLVTNSHMRQ